MKKFLGLILALSIIALMAVILLKPETYVSSAAEGLKLWALVVVPSLLPFFFFTTMLSKIGVTKRIAKVFDKPCEKIFGTNGISAYVFLMSVLSGYPVGAKVIGDLGENGLISDVEATKMSTFCSTSGPLFVIGSVGIGMFGSVKTGRVIFLSHILSAIITGLIFRFYRPKKLISSRVAPPVSVIPSRNEEKSANVLYDCAYSSVISLAVVGGFICVFYLVADVFQNFNLLYPLVFPMNAITKNADVSNAFCYGLIECTRGCKMLSLCRLSTYSPAFASAIISFGGLSVIVQSLCFLKKANAKTSVFLLAKLVQTILAFAVCLLFCL